MELSVKELKRKANLLRKDVIRMLVEAGSGHPGGSLSSAEIVTALYFKVLRHDPKNPKWENRDRFVLSKGHSCPIVYAALARAGYFPVKELLTLRKLHSRLQGHPDMVKLPYLEASTGSLGQGLSMAVGMALGAKLDKKKYSVYCLLGDGELDEGQIWEAAMTAAHYKLENLCGIVDVNRLQIDGFTKDVKNTEPLVKKWEAFGWEVIEIDGNDIVEVLDAFVKVKKVKYKPIVILAHTIKGKCVSFMENKAEWHGKAPNKEQAKIALKDLERIDKELTK